MLKKRILSIVLALTMLMIPGAYAAQPAKDNMRGVWVASVHNIDFPSEQGMTADQLKAEADTELDNIAAMGLNTVFLQVRPSADALYPSELFPWSRYVSGTAGQAPNGSFDALGYWVTAAHERVCSCTRGSIRTALRLTARTNGMQSRIPVRPSSIRSGLSNTTTTTTSIPVFRRYSSLS